MTRLAVAPCSGAKLDRTAPARDLYTGSLHKLAARTATAVGDQWAILSAKHGLVHPDTELAPYDQPIGDQGSVSAHHVAFQLASRWPDATDVIALTPNAYTELLARACAIAGLRLVAPLAHSVGIGEQRGRLAALLRSPDVVSWGVPAAR